MTDDERGQTGASHWNRRGILSIAAVTALAGCSGFESYEFIADPAVLPDEERRAVGLAAVATEPTTVRRRTQAGGVDVDVTIRSHLAVYESANAGGTDRPASWPDGQVGVGLLSTPPARIGGRTVNPLARLPLRDVVGTVQGREVLSRAGAGDATFERGPEEVESGSATMLGTSTTVRSLAGVVTDGGTARAVLAHVARATDGDVVVGALVHGRPVESTAGPLVGADGLLPRAAVAAGQAAAERVFGAVVVREEG